jgi:hypothetical protein
MACQLFAEFAQIGAICEAPDLRKNFAFFSDDVQLHFGFQPSDVSRDLYSALRLRKTEMLNITARRGGWRKLSRRDGPVWRRDRNAVWSRITPYPSQIAHP